MNKLSLSIDNETTAVLPASINLSHLSFSSLSKNMKFSLFATVFVALASAAENKQQETRIAVIDNFVANPSIETAVDVGQWAALHFAGFYNIYLLAFEWRDNLAQYNTVSELLSWDFGYAWFKYIEPGN